MTEDVYRSTSLLGTITIVLLVAGIVVTGFSLLNLVSVLDLLNAAERQAAWSAANIESLEARIWLFDLIDLLLKIATAALFLCWLYRAVQNLHPLGITNCRYSPAWAVAWWFVPIMQLFTPPQIMGDLLRASDPSAESETWNRQRFPVLVLIWWSLLILGSFGGLAYFALVATGNEALAVLRMETQGTIVLQVIWIFGGLLAIQMVRRVVARQDSRFATL